MMILIGAGFIALSIGIASMGYFIGKGLQNLGHPETDKKYRSFVTQAELQLQLNLGKHDFEELMYRYPDAPRIELNGTTYYPYKQFMDWIFTIQNLKR